MFFRFLTLGFIFAELYEYKKIMFFRLEFFQLFIDKNNFSPKILAMTLLNIGRQSGGGGRGPSMR
jgi:hypothetical protein